MNAIIFWYRWDYFLSKCKGSFFFSYLHSFRNDRLFRMNGCVKYLNVCVPLYAFIYWFWLSFSTTALPIYFFQHDLTLNPALPDFLNQSGSCILWFCNPSVGIADILPALAFHEQVLMFFFFTKHLADCAISLSILGIPLTPGLSCFAFCSQS